LVHILPDEIEKMRVGYNLFSSEYEAEAYFIGKVEPYKPGFDPFHADRTEEIALFRKVAENYGLSLPPLSYREKNSFAFLDDFFQHMRFLSRGGVPLGDPMKAAIIAMRKDMTGPFRIYNIPND
jgi:hypothetical protein